MNKTILNIKFNLGDSIKDENNLQSTKLQIIEKFKKNYYNLVSDNNIPIKVEMYCSISHSAENSEKIEEQAYIYRRTGRKTNNN